MYQATLPCPKCGAQNLRGTWVCAHCGSTLLTYCHSCRAGNSPGSQFCQSCGQPLSPAAGASPHAQAAAPNAYPQHHGNQQGGYAAQDYQQQYQQYPGGYPPPYDYQPSASGGGDIISKAQAYIDAFPAKIRQIVSTTNPILLAALAVLVIGTGVFLILAFQFGWIKTAEPPKIVTVKNTTPPVISMVQIKAGATANSAIISWVTDEPSSSQVKYGVYPYANTMTPIQNDPTTGTNAGVQVHEVGLTNLIGRSTYVYQCISMDKDGNKAITPEVQFQTTK